MMRGFFRYGVSTESGVIRGCSVDGRGSTIHRRDTDRTCGRRRAPRLRQPLPRFGSKRPAVRIHRNFRTERQGYNRVPQDRIQPPPGGRAIRRYIALGFSWTLDCEKVLAGGVSRWRKHDQSSAGDWSGRRARPEGAVFGPAKRATVLRLLRGEDL